MLKINNKEVIGDYFAYDGCHKIYVIEDQEDRDEAVSFGYDVYKIDMIQNFWDVSCDLRFIYNWKLDKRYVNQLEEATFDTEE